jgi:hypothetical protein
MVPFFIFIGQLTADSVPGRPALDSVYSRYPEAVWDTAAGDTLKGLSPGSPWADTAASELAIRGIKDFSFDVRNGFDQGLQLDLRGRVESVAIEGNLSDQAVPGPTVRIRDVERMSLKASSSYFSGGIGNLTLELPYNVRDEIQGGRIGIHDPLQENRVFLAYALNRGSFRRAEFAGEEGKQSPYVVPGKILAGSERVYAGSGIRPAERLARDQDYTVDYEQSIVSFTNHFLITGQTRITVEYLDAQQDWSSVYQEADAAGARSGFGLTALGRRVYDDRNDPLAFTLSPAEIESLKAGGDDARVYHLYADTSSTGNYDLQAGHFVFIGPGQGHYNVTFFYAGENQGDYLYDPTLKGFSYVGPGAGNYTPSKVITLPQERSFYAASLNAGTDVVLTYYGSQTDRNEFSSRDDADNGGSGGSLAARRRFKSLFFDGRYLFYGHGLELPQGRDAVDQTYQWNSADTLRDLGEMALGLDLTRDVAADFAYGILNRRHQRWQAGLKPFFLDLGYGRVDTLTKWFAAGRREISRLQADLRYENQDGNHYTTYSFQYPARANWQLGLSGDYERRERVGITTRIEFVTLPVEISLGRRSYRDTTYLFGNTSVRLNYRGWSLTGSAQQSQVYSQLRDELYDRVPAGTGNYEYDSVTNTYRPREGGDYTKRIILLKEFEPVTNRNYDLDMSYVQSAFSGRGSFSYLDQKLFLNSVTNLLLYWNPGPYGLEFDAGQNYNRDQRYALAAIVTRDRTLAVQPSLNRNYLLLQVRDQSEKWADFAREGRIQYSAEIFSEIGAKPYFQPRVGYGYHKISTEYFPGLDVRLQIPKAGLRIGYPFPGRGRIEIGGELVYRRFNIADIPYFFAIVDPPGLSKNLDLTAGWSVAENTVLNLGYHVEFPPSGPVLQNLKFNTRIKF